MEHISNFEDLIKIDEDLDQLIGKISINGSIQSRYDYYDFECNSHDISNLFDHVERYAFCTIDDKSEYYYSTYFYIIVIDSLMNEPINIEGLIRTLIKGHKIGLKNSGRFFCDQKMT